jgi:hypothetical protein
VDLCSSQLALVLSARERARDMAGSLVDAKVVEGFRSEESFRRAGVSVMLLETGRQRWAQVRL